MRVFKGSVSLLLSMLIIMSLICASPISTNAAEKTAAANNGIPVINIDIDENAAGYGTIEQMNSSPDHSAECTYKIKVRITAKGNLNYKAKTINKSVSIIIK